MCCDNISMNRNYANNATSTIETICMESDGEILFPSVRLTEQLLTLSVFKTIIFVYIYIVIDITMIVWNVIIMRSLFFLPLLHFHPSLINSNITLVKCIMYHVAFDLIV